MRAAGLTPLDNAKEYADIFESLTHTNPSSDPLDVFLMQQSALEIVRTRRMARLEADHVVALSSSPDLDSSSEGGTPTISFAMMKDCAVPVFDAFDRYR